MAFLHCLPSLCVCNSLQRYLVVEKGFLYFSRSYAQMVKGKPYPQHLLDLVACNMGFLTNGPSRVSQKLDRGFLPTFGRLQSLDWTGMKLINEVIAAWAMVYSRVLGEGGEGRGIVPTPPPEIKGVALMVLG